MSANGYRDYFKVLGIERSTFLFNDQGVLHQAWRGVSVPGHAEAVLQAVKALKSH